MGGASAVQAGRPPPARSWLSKRETSQHTARAPISQAAQGAQPRSQGKAQSSTGTDTHPPTCHPPASCPPTWASAHAAVDLDEPGTAAGILALHVEHALVETKGALVRGADRGHLLGPTGVRGHWVQRVRGPAGVKRGRGAAAQVARIHSYAGRRHGVWGHHNPDGPGRPPTPHRDEPQRADAADRQVAELALLRSGEDGGGV